MAKQSYYIVALPGDGIGPEVLSEGLRVLRAAGELFQIDFKVEEIECGGHYYAEHEIEWPDGSFEKCEAADAIILGAVGHEVDGKTVFTKPGKPYPEPQLAGFAQVIGNRQKLNLYANVRPVKLYAGVKHKIHGELKQVWEPGKVDYVVIRENTEDAYTGETNEIDGGKVTPILITRAATERVVRFACKLAHKRNKQLKVTCVDKSNIIGAHRFFRDVFREVGQTEFPDLKLDYAYVDAFCQWQIRNPEWYDVVVAPNLPGDIISDNGATTAGGLGLAVGGNIGDEHAMFEPIHGSAPKHAGKDKANPLAAILSVQMMLDWLGTRHDDQRLQRAAIKVEDAVAQILNEGQTLTYDLIGEAKASRCSDVGTAVEAEAAHTMSDDITDFDEPITIEITDVFDLHTIPPRDVKAVVEEYLYQAHERRFPVVRIIHGKGIGVQRAMVRAILERTTFVFDWTDAPPDAGGLGATIVRLKPWPT